MSGIGRSLTAAGGVLIISGLALIFTIMFAGPGALALIVGVVLAAVGGVIRLAVGTSRTPIPVTRGVRS